MRTPADFRFQLTQEEYDLLRCQIGISKDTGPQTGGAGKKSFAITRIESESMVRELLERLNRS